jgi:PTH1 family peptidyl-tRNA hydrolase
MALFQRQPQAGETAQLYTLGLNKTVLVVGLGNIGKEFDDTRHNIGFDCVDEFAKANEFDKWINKKDLKCMLSSQTLGSVRVLLAKPTTMMNLSGQALQKLMDFYEISNDKLLVVHDELDIDFGQIRTRVGGTAAGHNGIKSIIEQIGENFGRVRVGIGPKKPEQIDSANFVLQKFSKDEQKNLTALTREVSAILSEFVYGAGQLLAETRNFLL